MTKHKSQRSEFPTVVIPLLIAARLGWADGAGPYTLLTEPPPPAKVLALSALVAAAPRSDRAGGRRGKNVGRRLLAPAGGHLEAHSITLSGDLWRRIEQLGGGNRSAGVRRLAEGAIEEQDAWAGKSSRSPNHQATG